MPRIFWVACILATASLVRPVAAQPPPLELYAALPQADNIRMSPDGSSVAMISPRDRALAVRLWRPQGPVDWFLPSNDHQLNWLTWKTNNRLLLSLRSTDWESRQSPVGLTRLIFADLAEKQTIEVTFRPPVYPPNTIVMNKQSYRPPHVQDRLVSLLPDDPEHILLSASHEGGLRPEVLRVDVHGGDPVPVQRSAGNVVKWWADAGGVVRIKASLDSDDGFPGLTFRIRDSEVSPWRLLRHGGIDHGARFIPLSFSRQNSSILFALADQQNGRLALTEIDGMSGATGLVLAADPQCDIEPVLRDDQLVGYFNPCRSASETYLDSGWQQDQALAQHSLKTELVTLIDRTEDGRFTLLRSQASATAPPIFWYLDKSGPQKMLLKIIDNYGAIPADQLAPTQMVRITARDGASLPALLTLPPHAPAGPLGFIILPHGGPTAHDTISFDWMVQFIASRGYGVLQPQYRGSSGFGADFQRAGYRQWGGRMQQDVTDATRWLIAEHWADPKRICLVGLSYGGYAALMGAAQQPELYQCSVAVAPVTDLERLLHDRDHAEFGDINRDRIVGSLELNLDQSPVNLASAFTMPVLLLHGRQDFTVPVGHSQDMERRLRQAGHQVRAVYLDHSDHFLTHDGDRLICLKEIDSFLNANLGTAIQQPRS